MIGKHVRKRVLLAQNLPRDWRFRRPSTQSPDNRRCPNSKPAAHEGNTGAWKPQNVHNIDFVGARENLKCGPRMAILAAGHATPHQVFFPARSPDADGARRGRNGCTGILNTNSSFGGNCQMVQIIGRQPRLDGNGLYWNAAGKESPGLEGPDLLEKQLGSWRDGCAGLRCGGVFKL